MVMVQVEGRVAEVTSVTGPVILSYAPYLSLEEALKKKTRYFERLSTFLAILFHRSRFPLPYLLFLFL